MNHQVVATSESDIDQLDPYSSGFVKTVLALRGSSNPLGLFDFVSALDTLQSFDMALQAARDRGENVPFEAFDDAPESAGEMDAFCYITFGIVTIPDAVQIEAFGAWRLRPDERLQ